ncbi:hypothetical protein PV08_11726 [Exophiala spinifera]|uniref:Uncharacterized protein n=1 Tax=Exophiala spinifera TaxID=91928 RepID=A0A0D2AU00_9EURO|nr:uncharacterized protein PV08_11726 [Exophiala spinifera]KIW09950.1 hypothetical protein PV08_11726 [Exophiala spinifera]
MNSHYCSDCRIQLQAGVLVCWNCHKSTTLPHSPETARQSAQQFQHGRGLPTRDARDLGRPQLTRTSTPLSTYRRYGEDNTSTVSIQRSGSESRLPLSVGGRSNTDSQHSSTLHTTRRPGYTKTPPRRLNRKRKRNDRDNESESTDLYGASGDENSHTSREMPPPRRADTVASGSHAAVTPQAARPLVVSENVVPPYKEGDPFDRITMKYGFVGTIREKVFVGTSCQHCNGPHPTYYHNKGYWEVLKRSGTGSPNVTCGRCCQLGHEADECGKGDWRDLPDNPPLLPEHSAHARPWPRSDGCVPFPRHYYRPDLYPKPDPTYPNLPADIAKIGFRKGFARKEWGLQHSIDVLDAKRRNVREPKINRKDFRPWSPPQTPFSDLVQDVKLEENVSATVLANPDDQEAPRRDNGSQLPSRRELNLPYNRKRGQLCSPGFNGLVLPSDLDALESHRHNAVSGGGPITATRNGRHPQLEPQSDEDANHHIKELADYVFGEQVLDSDMVETYTTFIKQLMADVNDKALEFSNIIRAKQSDLVDKSEFTSSEQSLKQFLLALKRLPHWWTYEVTRLANTIETACAVYSLESSGLNDFYELQQMLKQAFDTFESEMARHLSCCFKIEGITFIPWLEANDGKTLTDGIQGALLPGESSPRAQLPRFAWPQLFIDPLRKDRSPKNRDIDMTVETGQDKSACP